MKFSLIMATKGRGEVISRYLDSLVTQTYTKFELIIVDQNEDDRIENIIRAYRDIVDIVHVRSKPGLSRARNIGLQLITGDVVGFPDDDCYYPSNLLERIRDFFHAQSQWMGLTVRITDANGQDSIGAFDTEAGEINRFNIWDRSNSNGIFFRKELVMDLKGFDEELGVGSGTPWGSAEDIDYPLQAILNRNSIYYNPQIIVYHDKPNQSDAAREPHHRAFSYAAGMGRVLRKHRYPIWYIGYVMMRPIAGVLLSLIRGNRYAATHSWHVLRGRVLGWMS